MADNHIEISTATRLAAKTRNNIDQLRSLIDAIQALKATFDEIIDNGTAFVALKTKLGTADNGEAQKVYNLITEANVDLHNGPIARLLARLG